MNQIRNKTSIYDISTQSGLRLTDNEYDNNNNIVFNQALLTDGTKVNNYYTYDIYNRLTNHLRTNSYTNTIDMNVSIVYNDNYTYIISTNRSNVYEYNIKCYTTTTVRPKLMYTEYHYMDGRIETVVSKERCNQLSTLTGCESKEQRTFYNIDPFIFNIDTLSPEEKISIGISDESTDLYKKELKRQSDIRAYLNMSNRIITTVFNTY